MPGFSAFWERAGSFANIYGGFIHRVRDNPPNDAGLVWYFWFQL